MFKCIFFNQWFLKIHDLQIPAWQQIQQARHVSILPTEPLSTLIVTFTATSTASEGTQSTIIPNNATTLTVSPPVPLETSDQVHVFTLDTPIDKNNKLIIHRVAAGESIDQYASKFNTSIDAIRAINSNLASVLFIDQILVIPIDIFDVSNLPIFEAYQVNVNVLSVQNIVNQLSVAMDAFRLYNNIPLNHIFDSGEWVLV